MNCYINAIVHQRRPVVHHDRTAFRSSASTVGNRAVRATTACIVGLYSVCMMACAGNSHPIIMKMGQGKIKDSSGKEKVVDTNICRQENARWGNTIISKCHVEKRANGREELVMDDALVAVDGEVRGGAQIVTGGIIAGSSAVAAGALVHAADNPSKTIISNSANNTNVAKSNSNSNSGALSLSVSDAKSSSNSGANAGANSAAINVLGNNNNVGSGQANVQFVP